MYRFMGDTLLSSLRGLRTSPLLLPLHYGNPAFSIQPALHPLHNPNGARRTSVSEANSISKHVSVRLACPSCAGRVMQRWERRRSTRRKKKTRFEWLAFFGEGKILLAVSLAACVTGRPLEDDAETVATEITPAPPSAPKPGQGSFLGEVMVMSEDVTVERTPKGKKKSAKSSQEGPRASALVAAPEASGPEAVVGIAAGTGKAFDVGVSTGHVLNDSSPAISVSGATLTFNRPAQVIPVSS